MRTALLVLAGGLVLGLLGWALTRMQGVMLFHPTPLAGVDPARMGLDCETVSLPVNRGVTLGGWWCPAPDDQGPALLFFHGNAGNREDRLDNVAGLWRAGISVFIFDYRGYGDSTGRPTERGLLEDGQVAFDWLTERVAPRPVIFFGRSLGGAVAAQVARKRPPAGMILESTFTSLRAITRHVLPVPGLHRLVFSSLNTLSAVKELTLPLLVIHGTQDELVPVAMGREIHEASISAFKKYREVPGGQHNDTYRAAGAEYYGWIREFRERVMRLTAQ